MNSVTLVVRLLLVVVFATAGAAKIINLENSRTTVEAFGVPRSLARAIGSALPIAEMLVAIALLIQPVARWGAVAAALLLVGFSGGVGIALSQGRTPDCNCFGQVSSEQISWRTLARNGALIVLAVIALVEAPGASLSAWTHNAGAANLVAGLAVLVAALLAVTVFYYRTLATNPLPAGDGTAELMKMLGPGDSAPDFELRDARGALVSRDLLLSRGLPLVIVFANPTCGPCQVMMPDLARWHAALSESLTLVVIESSVGDDISGLHKHLLPLGDVKVLFEPGRDVSDAYYVPGTPTALAISADGRMASPPVPGVTNIENLIRRVLETGGEPPAPPSRELAGQRN